MHDRHNLLHQDRMTTEHYEGKLSRAQAKAGKIIPIELGR